MATLQCESCLGYFDEHDLTFATARGATLAFCDNCSELPRHKQYGVRP